MVKAAAKAEAKAKPKAKPKAKANSVPPPFNPITAATAESRRCGGMAQERGLSTTDTTDGQHTTTENVSGVGSRSNNASASSSATV